MDDIHDWYGPETATFGDRVAAAREMADMSQSELARRVGVRVSTLRSWENDLSEPRANRLSMMAGLLNVSMTWLINGQGEGLDAPLEDAILDIRGNPLQGRPQHVAPLGEPGSDDAFQHLGVGGKARLRQGFYMHDS